MSEMSEYVKELGEVLKTFDVEKMREFINEHGEIYHHINYNLIFNDKWVKGCMAKMIIARTDMTEELKDEAKKVLDEMGWDYETR